MSGQPSKANRPSEITLPATNQGWPTVLAFLIAHFHRIDANIWRQRVQDGKVHWFADGPITADTPFQPSRRLCYYREVAAEPRIDAAHQILWQNEHIILADKPHGLPVTPGGDFVNECLLERVRRDTGCQDIAPVHRLDKDTAGLVLFSINPQSRPLYYALFAEGNMQKQYLAVAALPATGPFAGDKVAEGHSVEVRNRLEKAEPKFVMQVTPGPANSHSTLQLLKKQTNQRACTAPTSASTSASLLGLFALTPHTGKTHQLRVHMASVGCALLGDRYYPQLLPKTTYSAADLPLQLLAWRLQFQDPLCHTPRQFSSQHQLAAWPEF